jgi:translation initiation factor IF-3
MKYRPKIGGGDFETKTRKVAQFLGEGHKVKITIMFRGREMQHPELGRRILDRVAAEVIDVGKVEIMPKQDGRNMTMVLGPDKKAQELVKAQAKKANEAAETGDDVADGPIDDAGPEHPELVGTTAEGVLPTTEAQVEAPEADTEAEAPAVAAEVEAPATTTDDDSDTPSEPAAAGDKN